MANTGDNGPALASALVARAGSPPTASVTSLSLTTSTAACKDRASTHTQFGISMTAGDVYTVAGGGTGLGGPPRTLFSRYLGRPVDARRQPLLSDSVEVLEVPATSGTQWGVSMTANDIYAIAVPPPRATRATAARHIAELSTPMGLQLDSRVPLHRRRWQ